MFWEHTALIKLIQAYQKDASYTYQGVCYGFTTAYMNAYLLGDEERFYNRLDVLQSYHYMPSRLFKAIDAAREKVKRKEPLTEKEECLLEIPAFFESVIVQQAPYQLHEAMGPDTQEKQNYLAYHAMSAPKGMKSPHLSNRTAYAATLEELHNYFKQLADTLAQQTKKVIIEVLFEGHAIALSFNRDKDAWELFNINDLGNWTTGVTNKSRLISRERIASVFRYAKRGGVGPYVNIKEPYTFFSLSFYSNHADPRLTSALLEIDAVLEKKKDQYYYERQSQMKRSMLDFALINDVPPVFDKALAHQVDVNKRDIYGHSCLAYACLECEVEKAFQLIEHGADINLQTYSGYSPIHYAIHYENPPLFEMLMAEKPNLNLRTYTGRTPLMMAVREGQQAMLASIVSEAPETIAQLDNLNSSALMYAVYYDHLECAETLIDYGQDIHLINDRGVTALGNACKKGNKEMVALLLRNGAVNQMTLEGSPESLAREHDHPEVVDMIKAHFAEKPEPTPVPDEIRQRGLRIKKRESLVKHYIFRRKSLRLLEQGLDDLSGGLFNRLQNPAKRGDVKISAAEKMLSLLQGTDVQFNEAEIGALQEGKLGKLVRQEVFRGMSLPVFDMGHEEVPAGSPRKQ